MILALLASSALAGAVYVNGVRADVLPEVVLERCTVRLDGAGNVFIDAPGYKVNITDPGEAAGPRAVALGAGALPGGAVATAGTGAVAGAAAGGATAVALGAAALPGGAVATSGPGGGTDPNVARPAGGAAMPAGVPAAGPVPSGKWWLVTEDAGSAGQSLEVRVNGYKVRTVRSGEAQLALDLGPWLRTGSNTVEVVPGTDGAMATKGSLGVFVGSGAPSAGVLRLEQPEVRYARRPGVAAAPQSFQLVVR